MNKKAPKRQRPQARKIPSRTRPTLKRTVTRRTPVPREPLLVPPLREGAPPESSDDVIHLILSDHQVLKPLLATMENYGLEFAERQHAFAQLAPLLARHFRPEEQVIYAYLESEPLLREDGLQGDVEHGLANRLLGELRRTDDVELWSVRAKVLAELIDRHLAEEERLLLPHLRQHLALARREEMGHRYLALRAAYELSEQEPESLLELELELGLQ